MTLMIASDIHGSATACRAMLERFNRERADRLLLLGDLLYHGPRNDLPEGYAPREVAQMLSARRERILCVRGNCDAEIDQMVLDFPILAEYAFFPMGSGAVCAAHGHHAGKDSPPPLVSGDVLLCGHTHVPEHTMLGDVLYVNPGSAAIPKEQSPRSYMTLRDGLFIWKRLEDGGEYDQLFVPSLRS